MISIGNVLLARGLAALAVLLLGTPAYASLSDLGGFGSRTSALGGAGAAWGAGPYASYANPAALGAVKDKRLQLAWGLVWARPVFLPVTGVVTENAVTSDAAVGSERINSVKTDDYRDTLGQLLGASIAIAPSSSYNPTLGLTIYFPLAQLAYVDTGEPYVPEYVLYRARTQRPQVQLGLGAKLTDRWHAGLGATIAYSLTGDAFVFLQTDTDKPSSMRFSASLKPKIVPYFGIYFGPNETEGSDVTETPRAGAFSGGLVVRLPVEYANLIDLHSAARAFGDLAALDFAFSARSTMFYDPLAAELGLSFQHSETFRSFLQADFQAWSSFEAPALKIENPTIEDCEDAGGNCGVEISESDNPERPARDIIVARFGEEISLGSSTFRLGYSYRPGIFKGNGSGSGNALDPDRHTGSLGWGKVMNGFLGFDSPFRLDVHFQYTRMVTQKIEKSDGDEAGTVGGQKIGAPGYSAGGEVWGGGATLSLAF
ncbi:MAG: hypothetical protein IT285_09075 [Bdellovibrionales bacterium]|nr:hypothetical protein [Bdellovibrionales bacterium]